MKALLLLTVAVCQKDAVRPRNLLIGSFSLLSLQVVTNLSTKSYMLHLSSRIAVKCDTESDRRVQD